MNDIIPFKGTGGGLISREDLAQSLQNASMSMPAIGGEYQYLKMDKGDGAWVYGQDETEVEADSLWAVNPLSLMQGWVAWDTNGGGAPVQEFMVPINRPLPPESSLPPLGLGTPDKRTGVAPQLKYQQQRSVQLVCISGEDKGTTVEYKQSSVGAMKLFSKLANDLFAQVQKSSDIVAVIKMTSDRYKHKQYGWIYNPVFELVEWRAMDNTAPAGEADDTPEQEPEQEQPAPRQRTRTAAAPQQEPDEPTEEEQAAEAEALAAEYAREKAQAEQAAPRRRVRR